MGARKLNAYSQQADALLDLFTEILFETAVEMASKIKAEDATPNIKPVP